MERVLIRFDLHLTRFCNRIFAHSQSNPVSLSLVSNCSVKSNGIHFQHVTLVITCKDRRPQPGRDEEATWSWTQISPEKRFVLFVHFLGILRLELHQSLNQMPVLGLRFTQFFFQRTVKQMKCRMLIAQSRIELLQLVDRNRQHLHLSFERQIDFHLFR